MEEETKIGEIITTIVGNSTGIKGVELATKALTQCLQENIEVGGDIVEDMASLVKKGELVEVEYVLPHMEYRVKSLYFPKGTIVQVRNA